MPHNVCPCCGQSVTELPLKILPDRGMVVSEKGFALLTGKEVLLLAVLAESFPRVVSKDRLLSALYRVNEEEAQEKIIDVFVCRIRKKIEGLGVRIDTAWGQGYSLGADSKPVVVREALVP